MTAEKRWTGRRFKCKCGCENYLFITDSEYFKNNKVIGVGKINSDPELLAGFLISSKVAKELLPKSSIKNEEPEPRTYEERVIDRKLKNTSGVKE